MTRARPLPPGGVPGLVLLTILIGRLRALLVILLAIGAAMVALLLGATPPPSTALPSLP